MAHITVPKLREAASHVLEMSNRYSNSSSYGEIGFWNAMLLGYLEGKFGGMGREYHVQRGRIDFRQGSSNPVLIEMAVRRKSAKSALARSVNAGEIKKLIKEPQSRAKTRILLLLDATDNAPIGDKLKQQYSKRKRGHPMKAKAPVRVLYVHRQPQGCCDFTLP